MLPTDRQQKCITCKKLKKKIFSFHQYFHTNPVYGQQDEDLISALVGAGWIKLHPEVLENIPTMQEAKHGLSPINK